MFEEKYLGFQTGIVQQSLDSGKLLMASEHGLNYYCQ